MKLSTYYDMWYFISWFAVVEANLITARFWNPIIFYGYLFASALTLSWVHGIWMIHGSLGKVKS